MNTFDLSVLAEFKTKTSKSATEFFMTCSTYEFNKKGGSWCDENISEPLRDMVDLGLGVDEACECRTELYDIVIKAIEERPTCITLLNEMANAT